MLLAPKFSVISFILGQERASQSRTHERRKINRKLPMTEKKSFSFLFDLEHNHSIPFLLDISIDRSNTKESYLYRELRLVFFFSSSFFSGRQKERRKERKKERFASVQFSSVRSSSVPFPRRCILLYSTIE